MRTERRGSCRSARVAAVLCAVVAVAVGPPPRIAESGPSGDLSPADAQEGPSPDANDDSEWPAYGNDPGGTRYSLLRQIKRSNVRRLTRAWSYRTGHTIEELRAHDAAFEATPILVGGTLYVNTPFNKVNAIDPAMGAERWTFDPNVDREHIGFMTSRGLSSWLDSSAREAARCGRRIFVATNDARLIALDAATGRPCEDFGSNGEVDLTDGIGRYEEGDYNVTSPPAIAGDLVITGSAIGDNRAIKLESGVVRAYDARTGRLAWKWNPLPRNPTSPGAEDGEPEAALRSGAANAWGVLSVDEARDLVFVPTGSASPDHYGGARKGDNLYADSVVALRASTGKMVWRYQVVHHDLWDYDVPAQPSLVSIKKTRRGTPVDVVVVATKMGFIFVLDRDTGAPVFPVVERDVPQDPVAGDRLSPTQPFPTAPPPLVSSDLEPEDAFGLTDTSREWCRQEIAALRRDGIFTPPSVQGTLVFPGLAGGVNWGSTSFHPGRGLLVANTINLAVAVWLIPRAQFDWADVAAWQANNASVEIGLQTGAPYVMRRELLLANDGILCNPPPWGQLAAIDLKTGKIKWQVPLGIAPSLAGNPAAPGWGSPNFGGPLVTAGDLVFIGAGMDDRIRAFDIRNGKVKWQADLPAGGQATPMTYQVGGKQYVVIAAGGYGRLGTTLGDYLVAFALPD